ncbi:ADP-ribosylation factor-like protein 16 [Phaethornis superciliosus]
MGPIWHSYYGECSGLLFVVDAANPTQVSSSCVQLLSVLSAEPLTSVPVLVLFNKIDLPCYMSLWEMKSLFRMQDIISCATQPIMVLDTSARDGTGLAQVLQWLRATLADPR